MTTAYANQDPVLHDIRDVNLSYLLLVQRLLREDYSIGLYRSGLNDDAGKRLIGMTMSQIVALANSNSLLCSFRLNDAAMLNGLARDGMNGALQQKRTTLALAQMPVGKTEYVEA